MGSLTNTHLRNSTDLIDRVRSLNLTGKKIASFDVKALFTNVPVKGALEAVKREMENIIDSELPLNKVDYLKLWYDSPSIVAVT